MKYVDVILPLPLEGTFTYSLPEDFVDSVAQGVRVLVPLGRSKKYIALVDHIHENKPEF
jgi:primosomal protein N' (replication factor Y)